VSCTSVLNTVIKGLFKERENLGARESRQNPALDRPRPITIYSRKSDYCPGFASYWVCSSSPRWHQDSGRRELEPRLLHYIAQYLSLQGVEHFNTPIYIVVSRASKSAIEAIEKCRGRIVCKYYNALALQDCVEGRTDRVSAAPTRREDIGKFLFQDNTKVCSLSNVCN